MQVPIKLNLLKLNNIMSYTVWLNKNKYKNNSTNNENIVFLYYIDL